MLIDWFTVAAQVINFLILVWLLKRFLYKPVLAAIDEREKRIAAQLQDAEKKKAEAQKEQTDFARKNEEFDQKRSALLLDATNAAKAERDRLFASARTDSDALRIKLQKAVEGEIDSLNKKIGTLAQDEVFSIVRKTLVDLAGAGLEERMTDLFLRRLHDLKDPERAQFRGSLPAADRTATVRSAFNLPELQKRAIEEAVKPFLHEGAGVEFETKPDLVSGIELVANGHKIAWSIADYLASLTRSVDALLESKAEPAPELKVVAHAA